MTATIPAKPICLPPAPLNGGPLDTAPPKVGEWVWQPKVDDWRAVIHTPSRTVWNQYGLRSSIRDKFEPALTAIQEACAQMAVPAEWLDAGLMENRHDMMRGCIIVFDLVQATDYWCRRSQLAAMFQTLPDNMKHALQLHGGRIEERVFLVNEWELSKQADVMRLYHALQDQNLRIGHKFYEGLVAKRTAAPYPFFQSPKTQTPDWIKHRFDQ